MPGSCPIEDPAEGRHSFKGVKDDLKHDHEVVKMVEDWMTSLSKLSVDAAIVFRLLPGTDGSDRLSDLRGC